MEYALLGEGSPVLVLHPPRDRRWLGSDAAASTTAVSAARTYEAFSS
jgi:hypothetical protein